jgi:hypothetical protein
LIGVALMGGPVILADAFVLIPSLMIYLAAIGPLNHLARQVPACRRCGGSIELPARRSFDRIRAFFRPPRDERP